MTDIQQTIGMNFIGVFCARFMFLPVGRMFMSSVAFILNRWNQLSVQKYCLDTWYGNQTKGKQRIHNTLMYHNIWTNRLWLSKQNWIRKRSKIEYEKNRKIKKKMFYVNILLSKELRNSAYSLNSKEKML